MSSETVFSRADAAISSPKAPKPNGYYSQVIRSGDTLHVCGLVGDDPTTGKILHKAIAGQTKQIIRNITACLEAAGSGLDKITRRRVYIIDMSEMHIVEEVWRNAMKEPYPVSTCVGVTSLPKEGALVEIEVDAVV